MAAVLEAFDGRGKVWFEKPREAVLRDMTLSHLVHHRGQFSVYLRLLEVPVLGSLRSRIDRLTRTNR